MKSMESTPQSSVSENGGNHVPLIEVPSIVDDPFEMDQFRRLIAQRSFTVDEQVSTMHLVRTLVEERVQRRRDRVEQELRGAGVSTANLEEEIAKRMAYVRPYYGIEAPNDDRFNVIVELGTPLRTHFDDAARDAIRTEETTIAMIAHADTVNPIKTTQLELKADPANPDLLTGRGVWDMKGAVLNLLYYIEHLEPPPGMRVYAIITFDEESKSVGAQSLIDTWGRWNTIDIVYSQEIGGNAAEQKEGQSEVPTIHAGRRGRAKYTFSLHVPPSRIDHGASGNVPDAGKAMVRVLHLLDNNFPEHVTEKQEGIIQQVHALLGAEELELPTGSWKHAQEGYVRSDTGEFNFAIQSGPGHTVHKIEEEIREAITTLASNQEWNKLGIEWELRRRTDVTSYDGYVLEALNQPNGHPLIRYTSQVLQQVYQVVPAVIGARSVADETLYHQALMKPSHTPEGTAAWLDRPYRGVISHPPIGFNAHGEFESVSAKSLRLARMAGINLVMHPQGYPKFIEDSVAEKIRATQGDE